jgi:hypothetical protein
MRITRGAALAALAAVAAAAPAAAGAHGIHGLKHRLGKSTTTSTNWSGYAVDGTGASYVVGSWTVQQATCNPGETSWSSPWVGIDGDNSNTVEQTGTDTDCNSGSPYYYAWYEMYPKGTVVISSIKPQPGDNMTGSVNYTGSGNFTLTLTDTTAHTSYTTRQTSRKAARSSVEWIMEGPSTGTLTDFANQPFSSDSATISGQTASLDKFASPEAITMVSKSGSDRATPSGLSGGGAFSVQWDAP